MSTIDELRQQAERGDAEAQYQLGKCYAEGTNETTQDFADSVKWFRNSADQGIADAQFKLGACYKNGDGIAKDLKQAVKWYRLAAEQGNEGALKSVFELARSGTKEAIDALLALAQENNIEAQNMVVYCYENGKGVNREINEAIKWYHKAAEQGDKKALENVQYCIEYGNKDSFSCISPATAAELSLEEISPLLPIESFDSSVTNATGLLLSPDDKLVVIFRDDEPAMTLMFEVPTWKKKWRQENSIIRPKAFSPEGQFLLVCRKDSPTVAILDANTGALVTELSGHTQKVNAAAWSSSNLIATGSDDETIRISRPDGALVCVLTGHDAAVLYLSFASDGNQLFSHCAYAKVLLSDATAGTFCFPVDQYLNVPKISPDGSLIAGMCHWNVLQFFQANDEEYMKLPTYFHRKFPITWTSDSKHLFAKNGQTLYIFHFTEEQPLCTSFHHSTDISAMAFSSDGERAVTIDNEGRVQHHLCILENALPTAPIKITASQMPLGAIPLFIPKQAYALQEALDRTRALIERTLLPTSFQNLQRALQCINDSSVSGISAKVRTENAIEDSFAQISKFIESESHPESAPESLKQSIAAIESAMQTFLSGNSSISLPTSLSLFSSSESNVFFAGDRVAHAALAELSKTELEVVLKFSHNARNKLRALEKVISIRAASFGDAIIEFDNFASELQAKCKKNSEEFTELVAQMKLVISASDADVNTVDVSTSSKESSKNGMEINESAATSNSRENNQIVHKSNEDDLESMILLHEIRIPVGLVLDVKVSPDGNILAIVINEGLFVFDTRSKAELWKISGDIESIAFSPTSTQLAATIKTERDVVIFGAITGARLFIFTGASGKAFAVAWSNSDLIASYHDGEPSILVRLPDGKVYGKYHQHGVVRDFSFSPDSTRLAVAMDHQGLLIIELRNQKYYEKDDAYVLPKPRIISEGKYLCCSEFSPDGDKVAYRSDNGAICVLDSKTWETTSEFDFSGKVDISWSPNSRFIAAISPCDDRNDCFFKMLASDGNQFGRHVFFQQNILGERVAFSPDGSEIITVHGETGLVQFWMSPLFVTLMTQLMPSVNNDEIPFGQLQTLPPIDTLPVEHIIDRITTLIDRVDHPELFHRLFTLLHQIKNVSATLKISESEADFLVIDSSPSSSSSSSSSSSQQIHIRKSTFERMLDFVTVNGKKLVELENKLLCQAEMFSKALIAYDSFVDELRMTSEKHMDKLAGFIAYLNKPPMSTDRQLHIKSVISSILHESVNQHSSAAMRGDFQ